MPLKKVWKKWNFLKSNKQVFNKIEEIFCQKNGKNVQADRLDRLDNEEAALTKRFF